MIIKLTKTILLLSVSILAQSNPDNLSKYDSISSEITKYCLMNKQGYEFLRELCRIGPRLSGSENSLQAIYWAEKKLKDIGIENVWLQPVMVPHWVRGNTQTADVILPDSSEIRRLNILSLGGSVGTQENGITANVIEVQSFKELEIKQNDVKGKIVFFSRPLDESLLNTFSGYASAVDQRVRGAVEAAKYGALAVLVRSITTKHDNVPHTGVMVYEDSLVKIPAAAVGYQDADYLHYALIKNPALRITLNMDCRILPDVQSYNVIGEIKGAEFPDKIIVIGGHFDSWDQGCGAHDDGAGCVQSMEVLYLLKKLQISPKRTIRCVLFINEENGSRGGKEYGMYAEKNFDRHLAAIESDRGGFTPLGFEIEADSLVLNKIKTWLPVLEKAGITWIKKGGSGVDIRFLKNTKAKLGYVPDAQRYMDVHHSANDSFDSVNARELELGSAAITIMAYLISEEGL